MARCEVHGLAYDPASAAGCVMCRRDAAAAPSCGACGRQVERGLAVCPFCGAALAAPAADARAALRRRLPFYAGALAAVLVASAAFVYLGRPECRSSGRLEVDWEIDPARAPPAFATTRTSCPTSWAWRTCGSRACAPSAPRSTPGT